MDLPAGLPGLLEPVLQEPLRAVERDPLLLERVTVAQR